MEAVVTALTASFTEIGTSLLSVVTSVLPIALPVIGAVTIIVLGIKIFKKVTGKA